MQSPPRVYVVLGLSDYDCRIYECVTEYFAENAPEIEVVMQFDFGPDLQSANTRGIITRALSQKQISPLRTYGVPVINVSNGLESPGLPSAFVDHVLGGRLVAEHFLARRFHHFGYYGQSFTHHAVLQKKGFEETLRAAGFSCASIFHAWEISATFAIEPTQQRSLKEWLENLPKPVGIYCACDSYAWELSKICDLLDLTVGRDVAIVGCGNWAFFCQTRQHQLSSVDTNPSLLGRAAGALLLRLINGEPEPSTPILTPPSLVPRASSDTFVTQDPYIVLAIKFIQSHIHELLPVQAVFDHVPLSRTSLERHFRKHLGYTVLETIHLLKIDHIKHLLVSTSKSMEEIATACGISGGKYMGALFREKVGIAPREYRHRFQGENMAVAKS